ncbi:GxxExxY protein [candidate division KSB1 bacterium]|nr:GxxExxY protein [candidate division KSB1 bacterium]
MTENELSYEIIGSAIEVHQVLGPGLLESAYEECLCYELSQKGIRFDRQLLMPLRYKGAIVKENMYRLDIWVEKKVIVDVKSVEQIPPVYFKQVKSYLQQTGSKLDLLLNFNVPVLKEGIHRIVLGLEE